MFGNLGKAGSVESAIEKATGVDVGTIVKDGKIDRDAAVGAAVDQIGRILGGKPAAQQKPAQQAPQADTGAPVSLDPNAQPPAAEPEPQQQDNGLDKAARSVLRNLLGGN